MCRPHNSLVIGGDIKVELVEGDILLRVRPDEIVELKSGDRQNRLAVELRVIKTIQEVNAAGAGGRKAHAKLACIFRVAARHEGRGFLMSHLNETDFFLPRAQSFHDAVYT